MRTPHLIVALAVASLGLASTAVAGHRSTGDHDRVKSPVTLDHHDDEDGAGAPFCTQSAYAAFIACQAEVQDDFWVATAGCIDESEWAERRACNAEAKEDRKDAKEECGEQFEARRDLCDLLGGGRYDPEFDPGDFVDPDDIGGSVAPNPYFPLVVGARWVYQGGDETTTVTVTDKTKLIEGVTCRVVTDVVEVDGTAVEVTDDWFAQDQDGNVWYCGEISQELELFVGDQPQELELVSIEGSWKAGREFDKPGMLVLALPQVGDVYREEFSLGNAEDAAEVTSLTGDESAPAASCDDECLVTRNFSPLSPGSEETKYYAPGVGLILEVSGDGDRNELVEYTIP